MRIAFDLDGVLADLHAAFARTAVTLFPDLDPAMVAGADVGSSPPVDEGRETEADKQDVPDVASVSVSRRQSEAIWRHLKQTEDFWEQLAEIESGAIARIAELADEHRWDVLFITSRPSTRGRTVQRQTQRWLQRMGFAMPSVYVVHGSRGRVAQALDLDVVVDDRPDNCLDVVLESKAGAVLVWRGPQSAVPASAKRLGIAVAPTVAMCLDTLLEAQQSAAEGSLLDRLRRLFGLRTQSASAILRR